MKSLMTLSAAALLVAAQSSVGAVITVAASDNFETNLGNWTPATGARYYNFAETNQPGDDLLFNYAPGGEGAADLPKSSGKITLTSPLLLATDQYEDLTIAFDYKWRNGSTTRRLQIEFSNDGGSTWFRLASLTSGNSGGNKLAASATVKIVEGVSGSTRTGAIAAPNGGTNYNGAAFTDAALVRFVDEASAGADVRVYLDNIVISGLATPIPEPGSLALMGIGGLLMIKRRRRA